MSNNCLATSRDIRAGKRIFHHYWNIYKQQWEVKPFIINKQVHKKNRTIILQSIQYNEHTWDWDKQIFPQDRGVIGLRYDNRPVQLFTNKRSAQYWADMWNSMGISTPNFLDKNPNGN